jgi:hypothetical protein
MTTTSTARVKRHYSRRRAGRTCVTVEVCFYELIPVLCSAGHLDPAIVHHPSPKM